MKKLLILLLSALSLTTVAQNKKTVAVLDPICRDNSVNVFFQQMVRGAMESAVTTSNEYEAYDRSAFDQIQKEQAFQRTGAVNDSQIKKMGELAGVDYVLVSEVSAYEGYLAATIKILNVTTGKYEESENDFMELKPEAVKSKCGEMASSLFGSTSDHSQNPTTVNNSISIKPNSQANYLTEARSFEEELRNAYTSPIYEVKPEWNLESLITEDCIINISLFHDAVKNSNFAYAEKIWQNVYEECPNANKAIYTDGEKILKWRYENSMIESDKTKYLEKLIELYDKRIFYFGNDRKYPTPYILGQKGVILYNYAQTIQDKLKAYFLCKTSIAKQNDDSSIEVINAFFNASLWIYQNSPSHKKTFDEDYEKIDSILKTKCFDDPYDKTGVSKIRTNIRNKYENL